MNPGVHLALTWWKPRFTSFTAGLTFMIKLSDIGRAPDPVGDAGSSQPG